MLTASFYWLAGGVSHAHWQDVWQLSPVVVTAVPVVLLLANQTEPAQRQRQYRPYAGE
ncbi:hypothetical protein LNP74_33485 [Klebsiella pneumoniae subsp. pneumoniae]|nr:hypothetical protein [Klebsiella pneumoniae subsp. pneumoniae]